MKKVLKITAIITAVDVVFIIAVVVIGLIEAEKNAHYYRYSKPTGAIEKKYTAMGNQGAAKSTLYPCLNQQYLWNAYYRKNRDAGNPLATDALIYTPGVVVFKTDEKYPSLMEKDDWHKVDVITCAAPNLRGQPSNRNNPQAGEAVSVSREQLRQIHISRARHILTVAAAQYVDVMVVGAFGCGAFKNDPRVVAGACKQVTEEFRDRFEAILFVIPAGRNLDVFRRVFATV